MKSKCYLISIILLFTQLNTLFAQDDKKDKKQEQPPQEIISSQIENVQSDPEKNDTPADSLPENINEDLLSIFENWHVENYLRPEENCLNEDANPYFPDSVYIKRMKSLPFLVPMDYNENVRKCIDLYAGKLRNKMRYMIGMSYYYFPVIEQKFDKEGIPLELKYLAIVESALNPMAQSRVGAYGLWQFMLSTAKNSGLEINSLIDERLDPVRATDGACTYLKKLYDMFRDWHLAIAAYNCGEGNVLKAIKRSGGKRDFWQIYPYLPRETRSYLPLYIAAAYVVEYHQYHGICPIMPDFSVSTDTLMVERNLSFDQIADILNIDKETIKFYNSKYKRGIIPGSVKPSALYLPMRILHGYINNSDSLYANRIDTLMALCKPATGEPEQISENRKEKIIHTVATGENIYTVANLYGVTTQNLRKWNGLGKGSALKKGYKLTIYIDNGGLNHTTTKAKNAASGSKKNTAAISSATASSLKIPQT